MIDPNSITDEMRAAAEPLIEGGQFTIYDAYRTVGARVLTGDPRITRAVDTPVEPDVLPDAPITSQTPHQAVVEQRGQLPVTKPHSTDDYIPRFIEGRGGPFPFESR